MYVIVCVSLISSAGLCRDVEHESTWGQTPLSLSAWIPEQIRHIYTCYLPKQTWLWITVCSLQADAAITSTWHRTNTRDELGGAARHAGMCWPFPQIIINTCRALGKVNEWKEGHSLRMQTRATEPHKCWLHCVWKLTRVNFEDVLKSHRTDETLSYSFTKLSNYPLSVCVFDDHSHKSTTTKKLL